MAPFMQYAILAISALLVAGLAYGIFRASVGLTWRQRLTWLGSEFGQLLYDLADPQELNGFVRGVQQELEANQFQLRQFLPNDFINAGLEWKMPRATLRDQDAAVVRAWDTEAPIGSRQGISRIFGELAPVSKKIPVTEEQTLRLRALETGNVQPLIDAIFGDAENLARSVTARWEMMRGEVLETAQVVLNENGVQATVDFGRDTSHEPAALAGAAKWDQPTTATPVLDITGWVETYVDTNGVRPALGLTSTRVINLLLRVDEFRTLLATQGGTPDLITVVQMNRVLQAFNLPPLVPFDEVVRVDGTVTRVISDDKVIFLPPATEPLGASLFGTTAEALELVGARQMEQDQAPGLVAVVDKTFDPVQTWTKVASVGFPVLANPDLTLVADVV